MKTLYLVLAIVGAAVPYVFFIQYFWSEGVSLHFDCRCEGGAYSDRAAIWAGMPAFVPGRSILRVRAVTLPARRNGEQVFTEIG